MESQLTLDELERIAAVRRLCGSGLAAQIRTAARLTLEDVARVVGTTATSVWRWENGERTPRAGAALKLAEIYGRLIDDEAAA